MGGGGNGPGALQNVYTRSTRACNNPFAYLGLTPFEGCLRRNFAYTNQCQNRTGLHEHSCYAKYDVARVPWDMKLKKLSTAR
jgi:hypothetical protein